tara:strand:+ start:628 stop:750 length:123 start_codon:yes stop_codon:yes gene_type:complete
MSELQKLLNDEIFVLLQQNIPPNILKVAKMDEKFELYPQC